MKFKIKITESNTEFIAISESEEEEKHGLRAQGP